MADTTREERRRRCGRVRGIAGLALYVGAALAAWTLGAAEIPAGTTRLFTEAATVDEALSGPDALEVNIPNAYAPVYDEKTGWSGVVALTADNGAWSGDMTILSGGVLVSNLTALGTGRIKMHPRTALIVAVSYKDAGQSLKEKVIDRIEVQNPGNLAESDLWVSFQVQGEGLRNDVDFSAQPYLWLSAPKSRQGWQNDYQTLDGVFTPCGDTYRFGYNYVTYTETVCLAVDNLCDGPDGTPRGVVFRGPSSQVIGRNWTFSGRIRIEDGAGVLFNRYGGLGPVPPEARTNQVTICGAGNGLHPRCSGVSFDARIGITVEDGATVNFNPAGSTEEKSVNVFNGPLCGNGTITVPDNGGYWFTATNNSFSGDVRVTHDRAQWIKIGTKDRFSWGGGGTFTFENGTASAPQNLVLESDEDVAFDMCVKGKGRLVKRGAGTLTFARPPALTPLAGLPTVVVEGGTLRRGGTDAAALAGWAVLDAGAAFDLGGQSAANVFLPYGAGTLLNPKEGTAVEIVQGALTNDLAFTGRIAAPAKVTVEGKAPWRVGAGAQFDGGLEIGGGPVRFEDGLALATGVTLGWDAVLTCTGDVHVAALAGSGRIRCVPEGSWPVVANASAFAGVYTYETGVTPPQPLVLADGGALAFAGELAASRAWTCRASEAGHTYVTNAGRRAALVLTDGYHPWQYGSNAGTLHSPAKVDVQTPWTLSFDLRASPAFGPGDLSGAYYGDGVALVFQDQTTDRGVVSKYVDDGTVLCSFAGSCGFLLWRDGQTCTWIKDKVRNAEADAQVAAHAALVFEKWEAEPLQVAVAYDGEKMVARFRCGTEAFATTNANARAEFAARFPDGAYISLVSAAGGWCCGLTVEKFRFNHAAFPQPVFAGALDLAGGTVALVDEGAASVALAGAVRVRAPTTLVCDEAVPLRFAQADWTFDFGGGRSPSLALPATVEWPPTLAVTLAGRPQDLPVRWTTIVDGRAFAEAGGTWPEIALETACGVPCAFRLDAGRLQIRYTVGSVILVR